MLIGHVQCEDFFGYDIKETVEEAREILDKIKKGVNQDESSRNIE